MTGAPLREAERFHAALLALLERIAVALETANAHDPIAAIERAIAEGAGDGDGLPLDQEWRTR